MMVEVPDVYIALAEDLSERVVLIGDAIDANQRRRTEVRERAGGILEAVTRKARRRAVAVRSDFVTLTKIDTLKEWAGKPILYRDPAGNKVWGVYQDVDVSWYPGTDGTYGRVALMIDRISWSEAV